MSKTPGRWLNKGIKKALKHWYRLAMVCIGLFIAYQVYQGVDWFESMVAYIYQYLEKHSSTLT